MYINHNYIYIYYIVIYICHVLNAFDALNRFGTPDNCFRPCSNILLCPGTFSFSILCSMLCGHASGNHGMVMNGVTGAPDTSKTCNNWAGWPTSSDMITLYFCPYLQKGSRHLYILHKNAKQTSSNSFVLSMLHQKNECIYAFYIRQNAILYNII